MGVLKRLDGKSVSDNGILGANPLTMYDKYGSMAYGVILQIIPQPEAAQKILVDLFTSFQESPTTDSSTNLACVIIRLARTKALEAKLTSPAPASLPGPVPADKESTATLIFDLSFRQGYTPTAIAERLQISYSDVMKAIRDYFQYLRVS